MSDEAQKTPEPFFIAEEPRKLPFNLQAILQGKTKKPKMRWMAFSKQDADHFTNQIQNDIFKEIDGSSIGTIEINKNNIDLQILFNILSNVIGMPAFTSFFFIESLSSGNKNVLVWVVGLIAATFAVSNFLDGIKTHEYFVKLKQKMIEKGMDELVVFVNMWYRSSKFGQF